MHLHGIPCPLLLVDLIFLHLVFALQATSTVNSFRGIAIPPLFVDAVFLHLGFAPLYLVRAVQGTILHVLGMTLPLFPIDVRLFQLVAPTLQVEYNKS